MSTWSGRRSNDGKKRAPVPRGLSVLLPSPELHPWIAGVAAFLLYLATLCPTVWWISSGEFIASAEELGIPHAPGDSPYVLTARLFTLFFPHCPDWGVNLLSAVSAAFAVGALAGLCPVDPKREKAARGAALLAAAFLAGSLCLWTQATVGERRSFLLALLAGALLAFKHYLETSRVRGMLLGFFLLGIASAIRPNALVFALAGSVFIVFRAGRTQPGQPAGGTWVRALIFFLMGFSVSLYLPLRSPAAPFSFLTFGADRFIPWIKEMSGLSFLGHTHPAVPVSLGSQAPRFVGALGLEFGPLGFLAAMAGLASLRKARSPVYGLYLLFLLADIATWVPFRPFGQGIQHYALFSFFLMGPFMALGIIEGMGFLKERFSQKIVLAALVAGVFLNGWNHWGDSDRSRDFSAGDYASSCLSLSQGASALFFDADNEYFTLLPGYFHDHRGPRRLVYAPIFEATNHVSWVAALPGALDKGPVYTAFRDDQLAQRILLVPEGPLYRVSPFLSPIEVEPEARGQGAFAEFENGVRLRGSILGGEYLGNSRLFGLDLAWSALKRKIPGFWVGVYLSDSQGRFRFLDAFPPALGLSAPGQWKQGQAFHERKVFLLPWDLPAGDWRVNVGLYPESNVNVQASAPPQPNDTLYSEINPFSQRYQGTAGMMGKFQSVLLSKGPEPGNFILPVGREGVPVVALGNSLLHVEPDLPLFPLGPRVRGQVTLLPASPPGGA